MDQVQLIELLRLLGAGMRDGSAELKVRALHLVTYIVNGRFHVELGRCDDFGYSRYR